MNREVDTHKYRSSYSLLHIHVIFIWILGSQNKEYDKEARSIYDHIKHNKGACSYKRSFQLCMMANFSCVFKINFFKKFFQEHH